MVLYGKCVRRAAPSHDRHTGFAIGRVGKHYPLLYFSLSDDPSRCSCRTKPGCLRHQSSLSGCRFGRSGSSKFVGGLLRLRLSDREPVLKDRRNPDWCRYRYICRPVGFLAVNGCRPKRIRLPLRGCLRSRAACVRSIRTLHRNCRFHWLQLAHL